MMNRSPHFEAAMQQIDAAHCQDPNRELFEGQELPAELVYAERMTRWLERLAPDASEPLRLAARSQHLCRWTIPRDRYPLDRPGYLRWRSDLARFHADRAGEILHAVGYDEETITRVQSLVRKERLKLDPEAQLLEDVICMVFLEGYFADFSRKHDEEKLITILRRTWKKMSPRGHEAALSLPLSPADHALIQKALSDGE